MTAIETSEHTLFIGGDWVDASGGSFEVRDPFSGDVVLRAGSATREDARRAIEAASAAFPEWSATPPAAAPIPAPTSGYNGAPRAMSRPSSATRRPTGIRVRNATAASAALAAGIGHAGGGEGRHLDEDRPRGAQERQREHGAGALAEPQLEIEQRPESERLQRQRVSRLG